MDLLPDEEQEEIVGAVRAVLSDRHRSDALAVLDGRDDVVDADDWRRCGELGWFGLGVDEAHGGVGYGVVEEVLAATEIGASLAAGPFIAQTIAAHILAGRDDAAGVLAGEDRAAWVLGGAGSPAVASHVQGARWIVDVRPDATLMWEATGNSISEEPFESIDPLTPLWRITLGGAAAVELDGARAAAVFERAALLVAAHAAGIARATAEQSRDYALDREQFGQPIGSFQAVKHRCADMAVRADAAIAQARYAALVLAAARDAPAVSEAGGAVDTARGAVAPARRPIAAAHRVAVAAAIANAEVNIQNHGGIGFTWEHTAHRHVTRARILERMIDAGPLTAALLERRAPA